MNGKPLILALLCASLATHAAESQESHPPGIELPDGEGRALLLAACTRCHDLRGLPAYKGYWSTAQWRGMVDSMIKNGAPLNQDQAARLTEYLTLHFGRPTASAD